MHPIEFGQFGQWPRHGLVEGLLIPRGRILQAEYLFQASEPYISA